MKIAQIKCKSLLVDSGLADYAVNCYRGCGHGCRYCYARYIRRFSGHKEPWGEFVDVRINAREVLEKEVKRKPKGRVFISSVCDGWQPLEEKYRLSRACVQILLEAGFEVTILTKSAFFLQDLDILEHPRVSIGATLTTLDEDLRRLFEPGSSPTLQRIKALKAADKKGITVWVFLGPFLPEISDTEENLEALMKAIARLRLDHIYLDKLNPRPDIWPSVREVLEEHFPHLVDYYKKIFFHRPTYKAYTKRLGQAARLIAQKHNLFDTMRMSC